MSELRFEVPEISCDHCKQSIQGEVLPLDGVERVSVDLAAKQVTVEGTPTRDAVVAAIDRAGYRVVDT